jgi:Domain of unknown function (DUF1707)
VDSNPRNYPSGDLRVSDADRDAALAELSVHFQAGRLTADEMEERTGLALKARIGQDLAVLMADLPVAAPGASPAPAQARPPEQRGVHWTTTGTTVLIAVVAAAIAVTAFLGLRNGNPVPWWLIPAAFLILRRIGASHHHRNDHHRHDQYRHDHDRHDRD